MSDNRNAEADYDKAIELEPDNIRAYRAKGLLLERTAPTDALKYYNMDPSAADLYNNRGVLCLSCGRFDEAIKDFNKAISLDNSKPLYFTNRSLGYEGKGDVEKALNDCNEALKLSPHFERAEAAKKRLTEEKNVSNAVAGPSESDVLTAASYMQKGRKLRRGSQYLLAMLNLDQALRLNAGSTDAFNERNLCIRELQRGIPVTPDDGDSLKGGLLSAFNSWHESWNKTTWQR